MDLVVIIYMIVLMPFAGMGFYWLFKHILEPKFKSKKGYIKVIRMLSNGQIRSFWAKPEYEASAEERDEEGNSTGSQSGHFFKDKNDKMQFIDHPSTVMYDGNVRMAVYDADGNQMNIAAAQKLMPAVAPEMLNSMAVRTWSAGRAAANKDQRNNMVLMVFIAMVVVVISIMVHQIYTTKVDLIIENIQSISRACAG